MVQELLFSFSVVYLAFEVLFTHSKAVFLVQSWHSSENGFQNILKAHKVYDVSRSYT